MTILNFKEIDKKNIFVFTNKYRIILLFIAVFIFMSLLAPRFFNVFNLTTIMRTMAMNALVAVGFTVVLISGELDLSIGAVVTFSGVTGLFLKKFIGYGGSVPAAILAGCLIGLVSGLLVTKAKISSFIVTLGMMTILGGVVYTITGGNSISLSTSDAFAVSDWLSLMVFPLLTPRVIITILLILFFTFIMSRTNMGRNFYMVGGNKQTAWLAGINTDLYKILAFVISGFTASVGGVLFAMESAAATLKLGETSLMYVISATIIGGTAMSGGKGGVFRSTVAVLTLEVLYDGIILFGLGNEVKIFVAGLILASVILYEAYAVYRHNKIVGQRVELLKEIKTMRITNRTKTL